MHEWDEGNDDDRAQRMIDAAAKRGIRLSGGSRAIIAGKGTKTPIEPKEGLPIVSSSSLKE